MIRNFFIVIPIIQDKDNQLFHSCKPALPTPFVKTREFPYISDVDRRDTAVPSCIGFTIERIVYDYGD